MSVKLGETAINQVYLGETEINQVYLGTTDVYAAGAEPSSFSGSFSATAATSTVTSASREYTLGARNTGTVRFENIVVSDIGGLRRNVNGAGNVTVNEGDTVVLANLDDMVMSALGLSAGNNITFDIVDVDTGTVIEGGAVLERT